MQLQLPTSIDRLEFARIDLAARDLKFEAGRVVLRGIAPAADEAPGAAWTLEPLGAASGDVRASITDAQLLFDADVQIPLRAGAVDFDDTRVEHVGPDSRMGVSRLGVYVDAPNGRSYLYQFPTFPVPGVTLEQRGALIGALVFDRGRLELRPFVEALLRQAVDATLHGLTEQARTLLERTTLDAKITLGDGLVQAPGLRLRLQRMAPDDNVVTVVSESVSAGLTLAIPSLRARELSLQWQGRRVACDAVEADLKISLG